MDASDARINRCDNSSAISAVVSAAIKQRQNPKTASSKDRLIHEDAQTFS
jgi:hypothetical protein